MGLRLFNSGAFNKDPQWHLEEAARLVDEAVRLIQESGAEVVGFDGTQYIQKATEAARLIRETAKELES